MSKHTDMVGLLKYAMDAGKKQAAAKPAVKSAAARTALRTKLAAFVKKSTFNPALSTFAQPTVRGFATSALTKTPGWAKALALLGVGGAGAAAGWHAGNEINKRFDPGVDNEAKGIGMNRNLRNALTENIAKSTQWANELGGLQHASRNAYSALYNN